MSIINPTLYNFTKPSSEAICYDANMVNSKGIFLGDKPFRFSVPLVLFNIAFMCLTTNTTYYLLKRFGQSRFVAELLTGMLLGPSMLGGINAFQKTLYPVWAHVILDTISLLSYILFMFGVGVKTDLSLLRNAGRRSVSIGFASYLLPLGVCLGLIYGLRNCFSNELLHSPLIIFIASRLSLTSFPVLAAALEELQLLNSELGRIAMSSTLITDVVDWVVSTLLSSYWMITSAKTHTSAVGIVGSFLVIIGFILLVARPAVLWSARQTPPGETLSEGHFLLLLLTVVLMSIATQSFGFNSTLGPLMLGLSIPGGMPVGQTLTERLEPLCNGMFLPLYLVIAGYRTTVTTIYRLKSWVVIESVVVICFLFKLFGAMAAARYYEMSMTDSISIGLILNIKGIVEISFFNTYAWGTSQFLTVEHFSVLAVSMLIITAGTTPMIKFLYNPTMHYVARKRRTIEHARPESGVRFMACVHNEDHVAPLLDLLEASHASRESPIFLTLLHLSELSGHSAAVLRPHKRSRRSVAPTVSDRIVNAFLYFERQQQEQGAVSVQPFVAIAPYSTLYNDVCYLALDRKICIILLPFHKSSDGAQQTVIHAYQSLNRNVLTYAPCSVAILIDRRLPAASCAFTNHLLHRIGVYFFGGPDDREALAFASRMANNRSMHLTVLRFLPAESTEEANDRNKERKADEAALERLSERHADNDGVQYMERTVVDGEGTAAVMRAMSDKFDLVIVGRRKGVESELTRGLSEWSECPELGIIGDMLAAADFMEKVSVLVMQQQKRYRGGDDNELGLNNGGNNEGADRPGRCVNGGGSEER